MSMTDAKTIVLCSDGTGNSDIKGRGTNVFKLYEAIDIQGHKCNLDLPQQLAFYDDGVGTSDNPIKKLLGEAFGWGFSSNVQQLYIQLVRAYQSSDDRLFLFGFSRGAYTVRALSGMIQALGILDSSQFLNKAALDTAVERCWQVFYGHAFNHKALNIECLEDLVFFTAIEIDFIGVWDTVGAVGTPFEELTLVLNRLYPSRFVSLQPGRVIRACQALSIDDERMTFRPELWDEAGANPGQIEQVWFAGVHSNVGGGYPKQGMSLVALDWMMEQAEQFGLRFIEAARTYVSTEQDVQGELYNPRTGLGIYYRWQPRDIQALCQARNIHQAKIHVSVYERIAQSTEDYAPGNIPFDSLIVSHARCYHPDNLWPGHSVLAAIQAQVSAAGTDFPGQTSLMQGMSSTIYQGKAAYYTFLGMSVIAVIALLVCPAQFLIILVGLAIMGIAIWYWATLINRTFKSVYSSFWSGRHIKNTLSLRKNLRALGL